MPEEEAIQSSLPRAENNRYSYYFQQEDIHGINNALKVPDYRFFSYYDDDMIASKSYEKWRSQKLDHLKALVEAEEEETAVPNSIDWESIALKMNSQFTSENNNLYSSRDCYMKYRNDIRGSLNKSPWLKEEDLKLKSLADKYECHNWFAIAKELDTNRTPMQCLTRYQQALNPELLKGNQSWSKEENETVFQFISTFGHFSKANIADFLPGRSVAQITNKLARFADCMNPNEGKWSSFEEKKLFLAAVSYDANTSETNIQKNTVINIDDNDNDNPSEESAQKYIFPVQVTRCVGKRTFDSCKGKWLGYLDPTLTHDAFTAEEDSLLLQITHSESEGPKDWERLAAQFPGRSTISLYHRWRLIEDKDIVNSYISELKKKKRLHVPKFLKSSAKSSISTDDFESVIKIELLQNI